MDVLGLSRDYLRAPRSTYRVAVFLDRDGTINEDTDYPHRLDDLCFLPGSLDAMSKLARLPVAIVIVTNQAGLALGRYGFDEMHAFNAALVGQVEAHGGRIDAIYYCPSLETPAGQGPIEPGNCSKPQPGMLIEAAADLELDLRASVMIGDKKSDVLAGQRAGCRSILVLTGKAGRDEGPEVRPEFTVANLEAAVDLLAKDNAAGIGDAT